MVKSLTTIFPAGMPIPMTPSNIVVYAGKGTKTANETAWSIAAEIDPDFHQICFADAADIKRGTILKGAALVVLPGGEDRYYCEDLQGGGIDNIAKTARHAALLAICAGAYTGASSLEYHEGLADEVFAERPLKLFAGIARSVDTRFNQPYDGKIETVLTPTIELATGKKLPLYFHGGPSFHPDPRHSFGLFNCKLMAIGRYADLPEKPVAIMRVNHREGGRSILSGVHPELPSSFVMGVLRHSKNGHDHMHIAETLAAAEKERRELMRGILRQCNIMEQPKPKPILATEVMRFFLPLPASRPLWEATA